MLWIIILLGILGLILLVAEIYVPGLILGTLGVGCMVAATFLAYANFGFVGGNIALVLLTLAGLVAAGVGLAWFPKTSVGRRMTLQRSIKGPNEYPDMSGVEGQEGVALTPLRPAGTVLIGGRRVDVLSEGGLVEKGSAVRVMRVEGPKIVVRRA